MRMRFGAMVALVVATACGGPEVPLEVGAKEIPVDIVLGEQGRDVPPPPPASNPEPFGFPGFIQPPVPRVQPGPGRDLPPADPCPQANPLDAALVVARRDAPKPPVEATYTFRTRGSVQVGEGARVGLPATTERRVRDVRAIENGFEYEVVAGLLGLTTTTTYRVINEGATPDRGLYLAQIVTVGPEGTDPFTPTTPVLIMPFPSPEYGTNLEDELDTQRGERYRTAGSDGVTTMAVEARLVGKTRADACGEWVDAWDVEVTLGRVVGPTKDLEFTGHFAVATQFGGLVVDDDLTWSGTQELESYSLRNHSTINTVPKLPR